MKFEDMNKETQTTIQTIVLADLDRFLDKTSEAEIEVSEKLMDILLQFFFEREIENARFIIGEEHMRKKDNEDNDDNHDKDD